MTATIFEKATRQKLRFASAKGDLTVEQLWDLPLTSAKGVSLDGIGQTIQRDLREMTEDSLVSTAANPAKSVAKLALDIIKSIIATKQSESAAALTAKSNADEKKRLMDILATKQDQELVGLSKDEIEARIAAL